ncbi:class I SAM-dependent methyltransferase [Patescibacteria group bacterium]|nr:class I SAM-dependent methyltransferase [Patescibacteria group bacterium]
MEIQRFNAARWLREEVEKFYIKFLENKKGLTIVDYGCGEKRYKSIFRGNSTNYIEVDLNRNKNANRHLKRNGTLPVSGSTVDIVLSTQVLEHVPDPALYLRESKRVLKKNGLLFLTTHGFWMYHPDPADFWRWTPDGLRKIVTASGLKVIDLHDIMGLRSTGLQLLQDGIVLRLPKFIQDPVAVLFQITQYILSKRERVVASGVNCTYLILVAKK